MLQGTRTRRMVAATLLTIFATDTFAPGISYALTSGPTQPEATSFEPIDTTDMVNLQTGDLTYNIPLMEVPGPEGGYPLSLSYHAGIQTNEDASWVGLGWTLNPGAINRSVNGLPDDWQGLPNNTRVFWSGDKSSLYGVGVNIGLANTPFNASFGLSVAQDTYKGFGVGFEATVGAGPLQLGVSKDPYSGATLDLKVPLAQSDNGGMSSSLGLDLSTNFSSLQVGGHGEFGIGGTTFAQADMSTGGSKPSLSVRGEGTFIQGSKNAGIQTSTSGFNQTIPITKFFSIHLAFNKTRYWTDETSATSAVGSFYPMYWSASGDNVFDTYSLLEDPSSKNIVAYPDPTVLQGGAFPAFDEYNVSAQGLGGNMRPYFYEGGLMGQSHKDQNGNAYDTYYFGSVTGLPQQFRFIGDFSNSFRQAYLPYSSTAMTQDLTSAAAAPDPFDPSPLFGNTIGQTDYGNGSFVNNYGANSFSNTNPAFLALAGSRHVDVGVKVKPSNIQGYLPDSYYQNGMINGFSITNESGVTYHYGLPAYSYGEENYQEKIDHSKGLYFNRSTKGNAYAYTWYLTTITGPDYVDRNNNGVADAGDWGYWVNFEYGKWSDAYVWRNPSEGFQRDEDNNFQDCSMGYRQVYYLNAIRTRSQVALFEKDARYDAKGASAAIFNKNANNTDYTNPQGIYDYNSGLSMKLSRIYLLNAADGNMVTPTSGTAPSYTPPNRTASCNCELSANVLDKTDVDAVGRTALEAKALRVIDFSYDYSLCQNTRNSFDPVNLSPMGKLTLKALAFKGKGGVASLPSLQFSYELPSSSMATATGTVSSTSFVTSTPVFQTGDLLQAGGTYYGVVTGYNPATSTYSLANSSLTASSGSVTLTLSTTKNPPYNKDAYDMWGMYKSDYDPLLLSNNENLGKNTSAVSARAVDAWNLRTVTTQLGDMIQLKYESDSYHQVAMGNTYSLVMKNISVVPGSNNGAIQFQLANYGSSINPGSIIQGGSVFSKLALLVDAPYGGCSGCYQKATITPGPLTITNIVTNPDGSITYTGALGSPVVASGFNGTIWTGNLWIDQNSDYYGGGIRVASVTINRTFDNSSSGVLFNYNNASGSSSGITTYLPSVLDAYDAAAANSNPGNLNYGSMDVWIYYYRKVLYQNAGSLYPLARELPAPGVMYEYVTVTNQFSNPDENSPRAIAGSTQYQFEVFRNNMVGREEVNPIQQSTGSNPNQYARNWVLRGFTGCIGNIKKITQFDAAGKMLTQTINHYLHDDLENLGFHDFMTQYQSRLAQYNYQGFIQERYEEIKKIPTSYVNPYSPAFFTFGPNPDNQPLGGTRATMTAREEYPFIQTGQTVTNYVNGTQTSGQNIAFDFYSGAVTKKVETDAYGNSFMTSTMPAYRQYASLGVKINNDNNGNMLTQTAATYTYKVDNNNNPLGLVSASVNTWSNGFSAMDIDGTTHVQDGRTEPSGSATIPNGNIWRMQSAYSWMPATHTSDGLTPPAGFSDFSWNAPSSSDARWTKTADITLYDVFSKALEARDVNNNYSATHMNYGEQKVILTGGPANYSEMAYSGAEDAGVNQTNTAFVQAAGGTVVSGVAHTGTQSLLLSPSGTKGFMYTVNTSQLTPGRTFTASVWVRPAGGPISDVKLYYDIDGTVKTPSISSGSSTKTAGGWTLINLVISATDIASGSVLHVWCRNDQPSIPAYVDDMRFQPVNASTTAYVYDRFSGELTHILDNSNLYTRFEYDAAGRLVRTYKEKFSIGEFKTNQYAYNYSTAKYTNAAITNVFYAKNNCPAFQVGNNIAVNIPANTYTSFISQQDADNTAGIYAQDYANTHGSCSCAPQFTFAGGVSPITAEMSVSGTTVNFTFVFTFPTGTTSFNIGNIAGSCALPVSTRTVPITIGSSVYNLIVFPGGNVQVQLVSGPPPTGVIGLPGTYDLLANLFYSAAQSGSFTKACTSPQTGSSVPYSIPAYKYSATTQPAADALAFTALQTQGQANANAVGTCSSSCSFSWASGISSEGATISASSTTGTFTFAFFSPSANYTSGVIGTITGGCLPSSPRSVNVTDISNTSRVWNVTIFPTGIVRVLLNSGTAPNAGTQIIINNGTYSL